MVKMKNFFQEVESHPEIRNFKLWKTEFSTFLDYQLRPQSSGWKTTIPFSWYRKEGARTYTA